MPHGGRGGPRPAALGRGAARRDGPAARRAHERGHAPVRALGAAEGHRQAALHHAHRPHPVVGAADAHLRRARARRHRGPRQGAADPARDAHDVRPPPVALGELAVLGRQGHRLRVEPRADVPAAAHRGPAVPVRDVGGARGLRRRHAAHRRHRRVRRGAVGPAARAAVRHARDAHLRRRHEHLRAPGAGRAHALPRRALLDDARRGPRAAEHPAVVRAGEQVALGALRHGRDHHPRPRGQRGARDRCRRAAARRARARRGAPRLPRRARRRAHHRAARRVLPAAARGGPAPRGRAGRRRALARGRDAGRPPL